MHSVVDQDNDLNDLRTYLFVGRGKRLSSDQLSRAFSSLMGRYGCLVNVSTYRHIAVAYGRYLKVNECCC